MKIAIILKLLACGLLFAFSSIFLKMLSDTIHTKIVSFHHRYQSANLILIVIHALPKRLHQQVIWILCIHANGQII